MTLLYERNKKHIYNWVRNHPEQNRKINRLRNIRWRAWKKIQNVFLNILIDENV